MDFKHKIEKGQIELFLARWGRGKRLAPMQQKAKIKAIIEKHKPKSNPKPKEIAIPKAFNPWGIANADPSKPFLNGHNFGARLQKRGYQVLGSGCFSTVYAKGPDRVIKVTSRPDNWIDYVKWASEKGYTGKYAPMVYSYKKFPAGFSVSVVERMDRELSRVKHNEDIYVLPQLMWSAMRGNKMAQTFTNTVVPGLSEFLLDFRSKFSDSHDMCGSNMMLRKDGTFCVTDPVANVSKLTVTRLRSRDFSSLSTLWI